MENEGRYAILNPMNIALPTRLTVDEFLAWAVRQKEGKYELIDGMVIVQQAQRWGHAKVKVALYMALRHAIAAAGLPFTPRRMDRQYASASTRLSFLTP